METKICCKCKISKISDEFYKIQREGKWGLRSECKICYSQTVNTYQEQNKEKFKAYYREYQKKYEITHKEQRKLYRLKNKKHIAKVKKEYREARQEFFKKYRKNYYQLNKQKIYKRIAKYKENNPHAKIRSVLASRISCILRGKCIPKTLGTMKLIGCSIEHFKTYIESKFREGMTWRNRGKYGWHIDHIIPCDSFDLTKREEQLKCFHWTNLQPLWCTTDKAKEMGDTTGIGNLNKGFKPFLDISSPLISLRPLA